MRLPIALLTVGSLLLTQPVGLLAQTAEPVVPLFKLDTQVTDGSIDRKLSERELLKSFVLYWQADPNRQRRLIELISFLAGQQSRLGFVTMLVRQGFDKVSLLQPDIDRFFNFLRKRYPDVDFKDPEVLSVVKSSSGKLSRTMGGLIAEPNSVALFALIDPELAARGRITALEDYLAHRGTWDPQGNLQIQGQIDALKTAIGEGIKNPLTEQDRLYALQKLLRDQGVPIPTSADGAQLLVESIVGRATDVSEGKNLPAPMDLARLDPTGLVQRAFQSLEDRIVTAEAAVSPVK